jgi:O-methyltransferase domain/Dimerisation domain
MQTSSPSETPNSNIPRNQITMETLSSPSHTVMMQMITGYWVSQSIYAAAKLGIADYFTIDGKKEMNCQELAIATHTHEPSLYRLLRALASFGIFRETSPRNFVTTPLSTLLQSDTFNSLLDVSVMLGDQEHYSSWGNIVHAIQTGNSGFDQLFGMNIFDYCQQNPEPAHIFDLAMTSFSTTEIAGVILDYDFTSIQKIVDVAGGQGALLCSILKSYPTMNSI